MSRLRELATRGSPATLGWKRDRIYRQSNPAQQILLECSHTQARNPAGAYQVGVGLGVGKERGDNYVVLLLQLERH